MFQLCDSDNVQYNLTLCSGLPCVIAVLDYDLVRDTHDPWKTYVSLGFPR